MSPKPYQTSRKPYVTQTRAYGLLRRRFGHDLLAAIRNRRWGSRLSLRDAIASLAKESK